ncbi:DAK2 domain-containing protein [Streptomyces aureoverticillatus]|uniref:DAK2 domain-containing protein n=1 Tax=Streptomyces aureoverticillatus TaxID=66871 RepID=UPI0013DB58DC|nr:DAK2 domain-containing protein [Streptomyces aureoverticillatus]QIB43333.1 DAK2 domain-containing protein [Streptomyces aureoverticillatus]
MTEASRDAPRRRQLPQNLDAVAVRAWSALALEALGQAREEIDAINVYPVADGDTGTNLYLTMESASQAVDAVFTGLEPAEPALVEVVRAMAHGALIGARGNSGTILAQLLRGMAQVLSADADAGDGDSHRRDAGDGDGHRRASDAHHADGARLALALGRASESAYRAVAHPVEGTVLTVAKAAAAAADAAARDSRDPRDCAAVARAAYEGACAALDATPGQLAVLGRAGVVDAGGRGLVAVLGALVGALSGETVRRRADVPGVVTAAVVTGAAGGATGITGAAASTGPTGFAGAVAPAGPTGPTAPPVATEPAACADPAPDGAGPAFEVIYLLEAEDAAVDRLRGRLDTLGDSLVVVGGDGLWNVHVHVDDAGAAVEAGVEAGRPYRIRITHFGLGDAHTVRTQAPPRERVQRGIVAVVPGDGLAALYAEAGATTVPARAGEPPASGELVEAIRRAHAREVVLLPNDAGLRHTAAAAAEQARSEGVRVALIPTRSAVQGIAALAVHEPDRRFDEDVVAMTSAAGATRYAELAVAERQSWTTAGICQAGDVLGLIDGDVAVIGPEVARTAAAVLDRMLAAGGEMVTLVLGDAVSDAVAEHLEKHVRDGHLAVDTVLYRGGPQSALLLIGVE